MILKTIVATPFLMVATYFLASLFATMFQTV